MTTPLFVLLACVRGGDTGGADTPPGPDDSTDSRETAETGETGHDTAADPALAGVRLAGVDRDTFASIGYRVDEYRVTPSGPDAYTSLFAAEEPVFYVLRPRDVAMDERLPLILFHHGGAIGDDRTATPRQCQQEHIDNWITAQLGGSRSLAWLAAERRWTVVIPRNDWCDGWQGLGTADPVDPVHHFGHYHEMRALRFVQAGGAGFRVDADRQYLWGTSAGAGTAVTTGYREQEFAGIVMDSGFSSFFSYYELPGSDGLPETGDLEDVFGGPPFDVDGNPNGEVYTRYQTSSPDWEITDGGYAPRLFVAWNQQDLNMDPRYGNEMLTAVSAGLSPAESGVFDFNRPFPTSDHHVQTVYLDNPNGYYTWALFEFLAGADLQIVEAESGCAAIACVGVVRTSAEGGDYVTSTGGALREGGEGEAGVLYEGDAPLGLVPGTPVRVAVVLDPLTPDLAGSELLGTLVVAEDGVDVAQLPVHASDLAPPGNTDPLEFIHQYESVFLSYTPSAATHTTLRFETTGASGLRIDSAIWLTGG